MEKTQNLVLSQSVDHLTPFKLPPFLALICILLTGFAVVTLGVRALALTAIALPNPFLGYADILPGQSTSAIATRAFSCSSDLNNYSDPSKLYCFLTPTDGVFSNISVFISGGIIRNISFVMREHNLKIGDLEPFLE